MGERRLTIKIKNILQVHTDLTPPNSSKVGLPPKIRLQLGDNELATYSEKIDLVTYPTFRQNVIK